MKKIIFVCLLLFVWYDFYFKYRLPALKLTAGTHQEQAEADISLKEDNNAKEVSPETHGRKTSQDAAATLRKKPYPFQDGQYAQGEGKVLKILPDDLEGSRHQRFLIRLASGHTLLVAHNIDIAPRVNRLHVGDVVSFKGMYQTNIQGGIIHWTHHDPQGNHPSGWLKHQGVMYQ